VSSGAQKTDLNCGSCGVAGELLGRSVFGMN
jgi:hypothetical protein